MSISNQKIYFITYGDSKFNISKKHLIGLAKYSKYFDYCLSFGPQDIEESFKREFKNILEAKRGGGYWLWKYFFINKIINEINENDLVIYCDAGASFNYHAKKRFYEYIDMINESDFGNLRFENEKENIEKMWTNKEIFNYFKVSTDSVYAETTQLMGGHLIFKKSDHSKLFFEKFFETLNYDENLITDFYKNNQGKFFIENRHDQSIMSMITKLYGGVILKNETYFAKNSHEQVNYPFLSVRNYGHGFQDFLKYQINLNKIKTTPKWF